MAEGLLVYVTCPDADGARAIGRDVVERRLAACANLLTGVESIFRWEGLVEEAREVVLVLKTTAEGFEALRAAVVAAHPYAVPCIVALPLVAGHAPFLEWIAACTGPDRT